MFKFIFTLSFLISVAQAQTARDVCLAAELESMNEEATPVRLTYRRDIKSMSDEQLKRLPLHTKQHIIIVAKDAFAQGYEPREGETARWSRASDLSTVIEAVEYIRQINENRDEELLYTYILAPNGQRFRRVTYYPGAVVGRIFLANTLKTVAEINDGDVSCVE